MTLMNYLQFLEPMQDQFARIYSTMSGIIAVLIVLWALNLFVALIQKIYSFGKAFGGFYRNYIHRYLKALFVRIFALFRKSRSASTA